MKPQSIAVLLATSGSALGAVVCRAKTTGSTNNNAGSAQFSSSVTSVAAAATSTKSTSAAGAAATGSTSSSCPAVHVIGARETTASPGFGTAGTVVTSITSAFSGSTSEAITYPAAGGNSYASSVTAGIAAVIKQVEAFNTQCPDTVIVMVGYSQGSQIMDDAFCGGPDGTSMASGAATVSTTASDKVAALIWMGDPRAIGGLSYQVGTATQGGFAARPSGFNCTAFADRIQSYCDKEDPYCSKGSDAQKHQEYGTIYGADALAFVKTKVNAALGN